MRLAAIALGGMLAALPACAQSFYVSEQGGGVRVIDAASLKPTGHLDVGGTGPRGIAVTEDGALLLTANKDTGDLSVIERASGKVLRRIPIGPSAEMVRARKGLAFVTYEPPTDKGGLAHIAIVEIASGKQLASLPSGHETEGMAFSADGTQLLVTNEGDDTVSVYHLPDGKLLRQITMPEQGMRPRGIKRLPGEFVYRVAGMAVVGWHRLWVSWPDPRPGPAGRRAGTGNA